LNYLFHFTFIETTELIGVLARTIN